MRRKISKILKLLATLQFFFGQTIVLCSKPIHQTKGLATGGVADALSSFRISLLEDYRRVVTPNNDGFNDEAFFALDNPSDLSVIGTVYDLQGFKVSEMRREFTASQFLLVWDAKDSSGSIVSQGIYIYKIEAGDQIITGTIVAAK